MTYQPHATYRGSGAKFFDRNSGNMKFQRLIPLTDGLEALGRLPLSVQRNCHLVTSVITLALSAAVCGVASHVLAIFHSQKTTSPWWLPLWPQHFNTHALPTTVGITAVLLFLSLVHLALSFIPWISKKPIRLSVFTLIFMLPSFALSLAAFIYASVLNNRAPQTETIQSWTCRWSGTAPSSPGDSQAQGVPADFGKLCSQSQFAYYGLIPIYIFLALSITVALLSLIEARQSRDAALAPPPSSAGEGAERKGSPTGSRK